jgi:DNA-binding CsgD family transcriptional regulator
MGRHAAEIVVHGRVAFFGSDGSLTDREKQVLKLVAERSSNKEVAQLLGISVKTAMSHRERVMQKLNIHNRTELVKFALKLGVIKL